MARKRPGQPESSGLFDEAARPQRDGQPPGDPAPAAQPEPADAATPPSPATAPAPASTRASRPYTPRQRGRVNAHPLKAVAQAARAGEPATIGERIAARRLAAGLSQQALGDMLSPPGFQSTVWKVEGSGDAVAHEMVARFAAALGCDPADLDPRLVPARALTLARVRTPRKGVGWEPVHGPDRETMAALWAGDGPASEDVGKLVDRAALDGVAVVLRGDLPVKLDLADGAAKGKRGGRGRQRS